MKTYRTTILLLFAAVCRRHASIRLTSMSLVHLVAIGCAGSDARNPWPAAESITTLDDAVVWMREIELDETDAVINVAPAVRVDPSGGFLIADSREVQLRRYNGSGELLRAFGRRGEGPGELRMPTVLIRAPGGNLLGFDFSFRLVVFDSTGATVQRTVRTPFIRVDGAYRWDDSVVVVAGQLAGSTNQFLLHLWDVTGDSVRASFFDPVSSDAAPLARSVGWASVTQGTDYVVATYSPTDTLYVLDRGGTTIRRIPIPIDGFRHIAPPPTRIATPEWITSYDLVSAVHAMMDGHLLVEWMRPTLDERQWNLVLVAPDGSEVFTLYDTARLLTVINGVELVFVAPGSLTPNRWAIGRLRY